MHRESCVLDWLDMQALDRPRELGHIMRKFSQKRQAVPSRWVLLKRSPKAQDPFLDIVGSTGPAMAHVCFHDAYVVRVSVMEGVVEFRGDFIFSDSLGTQCLHLLVLLWYNPREAIWG